MQYCRIYKKKECDSKPSKLVPYFSISEFSVGYHSCIVRRDVFPGNHLRFTFHFRTVYEYIFLFHANFYGYAWYFLSFYSATWCIIKRIYDKKWVINEKICFSWEEVKVPIMERFLTKCTIGWGSSSALKICLINCD